MKANDNGPEKDLRIDVSLLDRYASGECSKEEFASIEGALQLSPKGRTIIAALKNITAGGEKVSKDADPELGWEKVMMMTRNVPSESVGTGANIARSSLGKRLPGTYLRTFALGLGVALGLFIGTLGSQDSLKMKLDAIRYATSAGQVATAALLDGTVISLNASSVLSVDGDYGSRQRTVRLAGHGFFKVVSANHSPFSVITRDMQTRVLGTEFSVKAYPNSVERVVVVSGRVSVNDQVVSANEVAYADSGRDVVVAVQHDVLVDTSFMANRLVLVDVKLRDALDEIQRWFGAEVQFTDARIGEYHIRGSFESGNPDDIRNLLEEMLGVIGEIKGQTIILSPR